MNLMYYELNQMTDTELLEYVQQKITNGEDFAKAHVMVYSVLGKRYGDEKASEMTEF